MLRLVFDENFPMAVHDGLVRQQPNLDVVHVNRIGLRGIADPDLLEWAAVNNRVVVSLDRKTLIRFANERTQNGLPMPGVVLVRPSLSPGQAIDELDFFAMASDPPDMQGLIQFLPLKSQFPGSSTSP